MAAIALSRAGKLYVGVVVACGAAVILHALTQLSFGPSTPYWLGLAALVLLSGPFQIRIPSLQAAISTSETYVFTLALFFGPAPATVIAGLDGLLVSVWARKRNVYRALFNIAEPAISVWVSAQLFYTLTGIEPLFNHPVSVGQLLLPLHALTGSYFLFNSYLMATAVHFETHVPQLHFIRRQSTQLSINYLASFCLVVLLALNASNLGIAAVGVLVPLLVMSYISSKMVVDRMETQAALRESEARFRELAENINEVLWMADAETGHVIYVSPAYERIWGRSVEGIAERGADWRAGIHDEDRGWVQNAFRHLAAAGRFDVEYRIVRPDGTTRWINDRGFPVTDPDGVTRRIVGIAEDITDRQTLEQQLIQSRKMEGIGRMAGGIAHDFNNILTAVLGYSYMALERLDEASPIRNDIDEIRSAGKRAAALTRQLLAFSRQQVLKMEVVDLNAVVRGVERMMRHLIGEDIVIKALLSADLQHIKADVSQVEQILVNLAVNARDAMPEGGTLTIETTNGQLDATDTADFTVASGRYVMLVVSDTGCGMDEATRSRIFEPFFTTKERGQGTGLGLATVYGTVKQLGGRVDVSSQLNQGATFTIYLPQTDECLEAPVQAGLSEATGVGNETVLVVEDDEPVRALATSVLQRSGYTILEAATPAAALEISDHLDGPIDLVLTDVIMPGMNGKQMADRLQAMRPQTKVLYMSGYSETKGSCLADGVVAKVS